jgi:hypothetical protein
LFVLVRSTAQDTHCVDAIDERVKIPISLQQSVERYKQACAADTAFQQQRNTLTKLEEQLASDSGNKALARWVAILVPT